MRWRSLLLLIAGAAAGCSEADQTPLIEYPPLEQAPPNEPGHDPNGPQSDGGPPTNPQPEPVAGKKIADGSIFLRSVTSDGALVFDQNLDLMVWPAGAAAPLRLVQDFTVGEDSVLVRGRLVAAWLGEDIHASSPTLWANTGGIQTIAPKIDRDGLYPKPAADDFAYLAPSAASALRREVWATKAGGGAGTKIISSLDTGVIEAQCRPTITYSASDLIVAGCTNGAITAKVIAYAVDGSNATKTILDNSAPGVFVNRARTHAIVQTTTASSIRPLSGLGTTTVALDGPIRQAAFSSDDTKVVYRAADGKVKRASTSSPASPVQILPSAITILAASPDARFVIAATKGDPSKNRTDIVSVDTNAPAAAPRTLVPQEGALVGTSKDGASVVYLGDPGSGFDSPLWIVTLPNGTPQKLSDESSRAIVADDVVYWQEFVKASKANVLKAARLSSPSNVVTIETTLDPLTSQAMVVGKTLYVGSKLGLWSYPAITTP